MKLLESVPDAFTDGKQNWANFTSGFDVLSRLVGLAGSNPTPYSVRCFKVLCCTHRG